jgi:Ca2+-transporting ATPase
MHSKSINETLEQLATGLDGLSQSQVKSNLEKYGQNKLAEQKKKTVFQLFLEQFKNIMIIILLVAAVVSLVLGEPIDSIAIFFIIIVNAVLSVYQEHRAGNALDALKQMSSLKTKVKRDGKVMEINSEELVPGDFVLLDTGDYIPADIRLIESQNLKVDESSLTGESVPVEKDAEVVLDSNAALGDRINCGYMSTVITYGRATGVVMSTGMSTQIGEIAGYIAEEEEGLTPLQTKLNDLGRVLAIASLIISFLVFVLAVVRGEDMLEAFMVAVSLAVAAIPEGLPAVVTVILALGMQRMVEKDVIVKKLSAVETLGSTTVICSDKTGTLTQNKMTVVKTTSGLNGVDLDEVKLKQVMAFCNDSKITDKGLVGDPTETALFDYIIKNDDLDSYLNNHERVDELPFDSDRKLMSVKVKLEDGYYVFVKGAVDSIVNRLKAVHVDTPFTDDVKKEIEDMNNSYAHEALRVLAYAYKKVDETTLIDENELVFIGLTGMIDPPRDEVRDAIAECHEAGIKVNMITGDHLTTASAIANNLNILGEGQNGYTGVELDALDEKGFNDAAINTSVFARVSPQNKVQIVDAYKSNGHIVAMTGDGVNDAPSLKRADIGVAMGITGTDVSKEAADMILLDDNFTSIVHAVEEGRVIYANIKKFVYFLISCNIGEILVIFLSILMGFPAPLVPIQLLFVNLITDSFPAFALGLEEKEEGIMKLPPKDPEEAVLTRGGLVTVIFQAVGLATSVIIGYRLGFQIHGESLEHARTYAFITLIIGEMIRAFSARKQTKTIVEYNPFSNKYLNMSVLFALSVTAFIIYTPFMQTVFDTVALDINDYKWIVALSFIPLLSGEISKVVNRIRG